METQSKSCQRRQPMLLPLSLEILSSATIWYMLDRLIERLPPDGVTSVFSGGGAPPYRPRRMRQAAENATSVGVRRLLPHRFLSQDRAGSALRWDLRVARRHATADFRTIDRFRSDSLKEVLPTAFARTVALLSLSGHIRFEGYFLDDPKREADASRHKPLWRKNAEPRSPARATL